MKARWIFTGLLVLAVLVAVAPWFQEGIIYTDDFRHHGTRFVYLHDSLVNDHTYYEWMPYIYAGWPLLKFYHPMSYLISLPLIVMLEPLTAMKYSVALALAIAALAMFHSAYLLIRRYDAALVAAVIYLFAPFVYTTIYVSGSLPRIWAYAFAPWMFAYFVLVVNEGKKSHIAAFTAAFTLSFLSHIHFAFAVALLCLAYLIFHVARAKTFSKKLVKSLSLAAVLFILLTAAWTLPLVMENKYSSSVDALDTRVIGATPSLTPALTFFHRLFGKQQYEGEWTNFSYVGFSLIALSLTAIILLRRKGLNAFLAIAFGVFFLLLIAKHLPLNPFRIIPFSGFLFGTENILVPLTMIMALLTAKLASALSSSFKLSPLIIAIVVLAVVLADVGPAQRAYSSTDQETHLFTNPPALVDAWESLRSLPQDIRVHSPIGQLPFYYHDKFEVGTFWMGYRVGAFNPSRQVIDDMERALQRTGFNNLTFAAYGYWGAKYFILPCQQGAEAVFKTFYSNGAFCVYENPSFSPLVVSPSRIVSVETPHFWKETVLDSGTAYVVNGTGLTQAPVAVSDVLFEPERITFKTGGAGVVLVKSAFFKEHWRASVDGQPTGIEGAWPNFMLVEVPEGSHVVNLEYESNATSWLSWALTLAGVIFLLYLGFGRKHG